MHLGGAENYFLCTECTWAGLKIHPTSLCEDGEDKILFVYFGDKRKTPGCPQITFYNPYTRSLGQVLHVEGTGDVQGSGDLPCVVTDAAHGLQVGALWRKHQCGVTGMHTRVLNMFTNRHGNDFIVL